MNNQEKLNNIKCWLFDLMMTDVPNSFDYKKQLESVKRLFTVHFDIEQCDVFIFENNQLNLIETGNDVCLTENELHSLIDDTFFLLQFSKLGYDFADDYLILRNLRLDPIAAVLIKSTEQWRDFATGECLTEFKRLIGNFIGQLIDFYHLIEKEKTYRRLFKVTELFNSTMESTIILDGVVKVATESFPTFKVELLLAHELKEKTATYRLFDYLNERASAVDAFLSGEVTIEQVKHPPSSILNAPIRGRQGIYGVLQITAPSHTMFSATQRNFIRMISGVAGSGLENASLYDQSHRLVEDLQMINEVSRRLNSNLELDEMLTYLKRQLEKAFAPSELAFVFFEESGSYHIHPYSSDFFQTSDMKDSYLHYVASQLLNGKDGIFESNIQRSFSVDQEDTYRSLIAVPLTFQDKVIGFIILLHQLQYYFSFDHYKLIRSLMGHASLAIANAKLRDQMQELVDKDALTKLFTRSYLDQAIGMALEQNQCGVFILLDVDNFKAVNDTYGHDTGDRVLKQIALAIRTVVADHGVASRWGGEEMAIFLPQATLADGVACAKELLQLIPTVTDPRVTVSIGVNYWTTEQQVTFQQLFHFTDKALYQAKNNGKNQYIVHQET